MLVYFVNHSSAPVSLGGAERSLIALVERWQASDASFEPHFITKAPRGRFIEAIELRGWTHSAFRFRGWLSPHRNPPRSEAAVFARGDYRATLDIIHLMENRRPDLVVTNTLVAPWGAFAAAVLGIPHAWMVREYGDRDHGLVFQNGRESTLRDVGLLSQAVIANSVAMRDHLAQHVDERLLSVAYPELDGPDFESRLRLEPTTNPFPQAHAGLRVTMVARLAPSKGQARLIEAIAQLNHGGIPASLCVVGGAESATYEKELRRLAEGLQVSDRVTLVGEQENPLPFVRAADVCVTASTVEAFGRSTLEYMRAGKAVVATRGGGTDELVLSGTTGLLVDPSVPAELTAALRRYAEDPELALAHGRVGRERALGFDTSEFSTSAAIATLRATAELEPYRLPQVSRQWFGLQSNLAWRRLDGLLFLGHRALGRLRARR